MRRTVLLTLALAFGTALALFQNATLVANALPEFPLRNVDTRTVQMINGKLQTTNPHIPVHDLTEDGRLGFLRRNASPNQAQFVIVRPERVQNYINHRSNSLVGANLVGDTVDHLFHVGVFREHFPVLRDLAAERTIPCEKTDVRRNPYVCDGDKDCYDLTIITRFGEEASDDAAPGSGVMYFASVDVKVKIAHPKTPSARLHSFEIRPNTFRLGPLIPFNKIAEPVVVGDNRLLIARANEQTLLTTTGTAVPMANIFYSVYPAVEGGQRTPQCDVTRWRYSTDPAQNTIHPIAHAPFDTRNAMRSRYKFARYPFRDSLGNPIPGDAELGGSYPWMDRDAANLFFTAYGSDPFYSFPTAGGRHQVYQDMNAGPGYFSPTSAAERKTVEHSDRTIGVAFLGFWSHGKAVLLDGLLNNADYGFRVGRAANAPDVNPHRKIKLYQNTPSGQTFEPVGAVRDRGNDVVGSQYHPLLALNSSFMGSVENRLNYVEAMKTVTPRDVVWHFGTTRHTDEVVFDDYMTPYALIVAEMTGAIGAFTDITRTMKYYDGISRGRTFPASLVDGFPDAPADDKFPLLFQNAATAPDHFFKVPKYGRPIGSMRLEPIAKGGMYGKGAWLEPNSGIMFKVPGQSGTSFDLAAQKDLYVSVFADFRQNFPPTNTNEFQRLLVNFSSGKQIWLARGAGVTGPVFDRVLLKDGNRTVGWFVFPSGVLLRKERWYHLAFQFTENGHHVLLNGYRLGSFQKLAAVPTADFAALFRVQAGLEITLGSPTETKTVAARGWYDDFNVHLRKPTPEERCNYARGTLIRPSASSTWANVAARYPAASHDEIRSLVGGTGSFACFVRYGEVQYDDLNAINFYAHLKNIPNDVQSVREAALIRQQVLRFDRERPNYSTNQFCLSCHMPQSGHSYKETDTRALAYVHGLMAQADPRRQPQQPPRWLRGVIPANYFGPGKPAARLAQPGVKYEVDQWVLASSGLQGNPVEIGPCERSFFNYQGNRYEQACGCVDLAPEYYPVESQGSSGQSCYHRHVGPASTRCERQAFVHAGVSYDMTCGCAADALPGAVRVTETGSEGQACYHRAMGAENTSCHRSRFTWQGQPYERACGCVHPGHEFYPVSEIGPNGAACVHRRMHINN